MSAVSREDPGQRLLELLPRCRRCALLLSDSADSADGMVLQAYTGVLAERRARSVDWPDKHQILARLYNAWSEADRAPAGHLDLQSMDADQTSQQVLGAVAAMPAEKRILLLFVCAEQLGYRRTATILGVTIDTMAAWLMDARLTIGRAIDVDDAPSAPLADDLTLMAFADDELEERPRQDVELAMDADTVFVERTALFIRTAALSKQALDAMLAEPVPKALDSAVRAMIAEKVRTPRGFFAGIASFFGRRDG